MTCGASRVCVCVRAHTICLFEHMHLVCVCARTTCLLAYMHLARACVVVYARTTCLLAYMHLVCVSVHQASQLRRVCHLCGAALVNTGALALTLTF